MTRKVAVGTASRFTDLPFDLLHQILGRLSCKDKFTLATTCQRLCSLVGTSQISYTLDVLSMRSLISLATRRGSVCRRIHSSYPNIRKLLCKFDQEAYSTKDIREYHDMARSVLVVVVGRLSNLVQLALQGTYQLSLPNAQLLPSVCPQIQQLEIQCSDAHVLQPLSLLQSLYTLQLGIKFDSVNATTAAGIGNLAGLAELSTLQRLVELDLTIQAAPSRLENTQEGIVPGVAAVVQLTNLTRLSYRLRHGITDEAAALIGGMQGLRELHCAANRMTDNGFTSLASLNNLQVVHVESGCQLSERSMEVLSTLTLLRDVRLSFACCATTSERLLAVSKLPPLQRLGLSCEYEAWEGQECAVLGQDVLQAIAQRMPGLEELSTSLSLDLYQPLPRGSFGSLMSLQLGVGIEEPLGRDDLVADSAALLAHLLPLPNLQALHLGDWHELSDDMVDILVRQRSLRRLDAKFACGLSPAGLGRLLAALPALQEAHLGHALRISHKHAQAAVAALGVAGASVQYSRQVCPCKYRGDSLHSGPGGLEEEDSDDDSDLEDLAKPCHSPCITFTRALEEERCAEWQH